MIDGIGTMLGVISARGTGDRPVNVWHKWVVKSPAVLSRRKFGMAAAMALALPGCVTQGARPIRVLVWDERQPRQKEAYPNWLGNQIADSLKTQPGLSVRSAALDDPHQGLGSLDETDVLIWWGHVRQLEIELPVARDIVRRIQEGRLQLIALHSAHWSRPFVEAMKERARADALRALPASERATAVFVESELFPRPFIAPKRTDPLSPSVKYQRVAGKPVEIQLTLPNCCFPAYRGDGKPSELTVLLPRHPIARGLPSKMTITSTEMYDEPFHVPPPDEVVFEERWAAGEHFRSGSVWRLGLGRVFYFRPGHEQYPVFFNPQMLKILDNAVRWLGGGAH